jgi:hypothetical protein
VQGLEELMLAYLDTVPDLKFYSVFIAILIAAYVGQWLFERRANKKAAK